VAKDVMEYKMHIQEMKVFFTFGQGHFPKDDVIIFVTQQFSLHVYNYLTDNGYLLQFCQHKRVIVTFHFIVCCGSIEDTSISNSYFCKIFCI
jgi:hypothetical protein